MKYIFPKQIAESIFAGMPLMEIKTTLGNKIVKTSEIVYIKSLNKHSCIYFNDLSFEVSVKPLKWFNEQLSEPTFFRGHDSFIINCLYLNYFGSVEVILKENIHISLSRNKKAALRNNLKLLFESTYSNIYI
jgi:DNA-binding LytR/AlgR family response regulator